MPENVICSLGFLIHEPENPSEPYHLQVWERPGQINKVPPMIDSDLDSNEPYSIELYHGKRKLHVTIKLSE